PSEATTMIATLILTLLISLPSFRFEKIFRADLHASVNADVNADNTFDFVRALTGAWCISKLLQLAGRYEQVRYGSAKPDGMAFSSPRARTLPTTTQNIWTGGVNWFVHPFAKFQFDGVHDGH